MSHSSTTSQPMTSGMQVFHRIVLFGLLGVFAAFFLLPFYVMLVTSLKDMSEIRDGSLLALPKAIDFTSWRKAWSRERL